MEHKRHCLGHEYDTCALAVCGTDAACPSACGCDREFTCPITLLYNSHPHLWLDLNGPCEGVCLLLLAQCTNLCFSSFAQAEEPYPTPAEQLQQSLGTVE